MQPRFKSVPPVSLGEATRRAIAAAGQGDVNAVGRALREREAAIASSTSREKINALAEGEILGRLLTELKRNLVAEYSRLGQLRSGFARSARSSGIDLQG